MVSEYIVKAMEFRKAVSAYLAKQEDGKPD